MTLSNPQILAVYKTADFAARRTFARYGVTISGDDLADIQQATLAKILASFDGTRGTTPDAMAWRVAANEATDYLRARTRKPESSLTVEDEDGSVIVADIADTSANPCEMLEMLQLDTALTLAIESLSPGLRDGIRGFSASDEIAMDGATRIAKMRAVDALSDRLNSSHFALVKDGEGKRKKVAKSKRAPKVATSEESTEIPALSTLSTLSTWDYMVRHLMTARLVVQG